MDRFENIPETALRWHQEGKGAVLATVVETWGSAPRRVGGQLVINRQGEMEGSVSGGCVEGAVVLEAIESLEKQVRIIRSELERINKTFHSELSHLSTELPEIEERGHVAAMSVSAYLASMLTLESD